MHIETPSADLSLFLSLSLLFLSLKPLHFFFFILLYRFYPEAKLDGCYNLTSTFLSSVTAAFARMNTGKATFLSFSSLMLRKAVLSHSTTIIVFFSFRSNNAVKTKTKKRE